MKGRRISTIILACLMVFALALTGCGGGTSANSENPSESKTPENSANPGESTSPGDNTDDGGGEAADIAAAALAYSDKVASEAKADAISSKDTLIFAAAADPGAINLDHLLDYTMNPFATACVEYFMRWDFSKLKYFSPVCESYEQDADCKGATFHLKPGIKMNDGRTFSPSDVFTSIEAFREQSGLGFKMNFIDLDASKIIDETTFHLQFNEVKATWEAESEMLTLISGDAYIKSGRSETFYQKPVGPMAYDIIEWVPGDHITAQAFEDYHMGTPPIKYLKLVVISDRSAAFMALQNGEIDLLWNISSDQVMNVYKSDKLEQVMAGSNMMIYMGMNSGGKQSNGSTPLADYRVRKAISLALSREDIIDGAYNGLATMANSIYTPEGIGYSTSQTLPAQDIAEAKQLMKDAGYEKGLTLRLTAESTINFQLVAEQLSAQLAEINITLDIKLVDQATLQSIVFSQNASGYDLFLYVCEDCADGISTLDNPMLFGASHPELSGDDAGKGWAEMWDKVRAAIDIKDRTKAYEETHDYFVEKGLFWYPVAVSQTYIAFDKSLTGFQRDGFLINFYSAYFK